MKHIKNKLVNSGHTAEEADLLVNNMYYLIRILIENLDLSKKASLAFFFKSNKRKGRYNSKIIS